MFNAELWVMYLDSINRGMGRIERNIGFIEIRI